MDTFKISSEEKRRIIRKYIIAGFKQKDMAQLLGISKQLVQYWVNRINVEDEKTNRNKPKIRKPSREGV